MDSRIAALHTLADLSRRIGRRLLGLVCMLSLLTAGCPSDDEAGAPSKPGGSGGTVGASGGSSGTVAGSGGAGSAGGDAPVGDGFDCLGIPARARCEAGQVCCSRTPPEGDARCVAPGTDCGACVGDYCGTIRCDGPEDCGGKPCCSRNTVTKMADCPAGGPCPKVTYVVECAETCEAPGFQLCHGFECPDGMTCELNPTRPPFLNHCK